MTYGTQTYTYSDTLVTLGLSQAIAAAAIEGYLAAGFPAGAQASRSKRSLMHSVLLVVLD